ncbi:thioesterase family protein [Nocardioides marmorisolisilvae]|uniref:Thioesterase family protein n=1 Tax=Nocardioides marmorisolisilvae TaxID=1542737 RepID=A0A3N0DYY8_9ACTN|nr:thioesterase family protein [Nocardioides marmorisolisilvae]RNL80815.1 thioesterase family protein [Nocardioides marmorisolisilvae]
MTYELDRDTAVTSLGDGRYAAELAPGWVVGGGVNGGYVLATLANAVAAELGALVPEKQHVDPFSVTSHFVTPASPGPAVVTCELVRSGGRFSTVRATLSQEVDGALVPRIATHSTFGNLDTAHDERSDAEAASLGLALEPPVLPAPEDCLDSQDAPEDFKKIAPLLDRFGTRFDPPTAAWRDGNPSRRGLIQGWFKLADDRPLDPIALLVVVDALPPVTFDLGMPGWAPTLELTAHVRARPAPGWAIVRHQTRTVAGGLFEEDCDVWDAGGRLVAQSRQLALQPR